MSSLSAHASRVALCASVMSLACTHGRARTSELGAFERPAFDLEGHRGARGLAPENTLPAFDRALDLGVTTLELDVGVSRDGALVLHHDRRVSPIVCSDTAPVEPNDPRFPYAGRLIRELTLAQLKSLDCGTRRPANPEADPFVATQQKIPGTRLATLDELFQRVKERKADAVRFNIETKLDPRAPAEALAPEPLTRAVLAAIAIHGMTERCAIQSFDWRVLAEVKKMEPRVERIALFEEDNAERGKPGPSPWLAGLDLDTPELAGDALAAAQRAGAQTFSPHYKRVDAAMVANAHQRGMRLVPWTVNDPAEMAALVDLGVDGIITDYPDRLKTVLQAKGVR